MRLTTVLALGLAALSASCGALEASEPPVPPRTIALSPLPSQGPVAVATVSAVRTGDSVQETPTQPPPTSPPAPTVPAFSGAHNGERCTGAEALLAHYSPGWDVVRMSRIMYRESRCQPGADNVSSTATGLLQILYSHCSKWLGARMGETCNEARLQDPVFNVRAAVVLWNDGGYAHWATS